MYCFTHLCEADKMKSLRGKAKEQIICNGPQTMVSLCMY